MNRENRTLFNKENPNSNTGAPIKHPGNPFFGIRREEMLLLCQIVACPSDHKILLLSYLETETHPAPRQKEAESNVSWWRAVCQYFQWPGKCSFRMLKKCGERAFVFGCPWCFLFPCDVPWTSWMSNDDKSMPVWQTWWYWKIQNIDVN